MCRGCPDFINRNPDDPDYFAARKLQPLFRMPQGFIDVPREGDEVGDAFELAGWAVGFAPVVRVDAVCAARDGDPRSLGDATLGVPRPDVAQAYRRYPAAGRSGWSFVVHGDDLRVTGADPQAPIELRVRAHNDEGTSLELGAVRLVPTPDGGAGGRPRRWAVQRPR
jgi:hypothetical protein